MQGQPKMGGWRLTPKRIANGDLTRDLYEKRIAAEQRQAELKAELAALENGPLAEIQAIKETVALFQITPEVGSDYTKDLRDALAALNQEASPPIAPTGATEGKKPPAQSVGRPRGSRGVPAIRRAA